MTRDEYVAALKSAALSIGKQAVMSRLAVAIPALASGPLNTLVAYVVGFILSLAIDEGELGAFFLYIDIRTNIEAKDFEAAVMAHQNAKSPEEIANAEKNLIDAARNLIKLRN